MSTQPPNAWQTAGRGRTSRTPQNRSGTASPNQLNPPSQPPKQQENARQATSNSVWAQRNNTTAAHGSNGATPDTGTPQNEPQHVSSNGFNAAEVKIFLSRDAAPAPYKLAENAASAGRGGGTPAGGAGGAGGGAWGSKANHMANNQPFFVQLAKQVATFEGGG